MCDCPALQGRDQGLRVLVTIGRQDLASFLAAAPREHAYLVRAIEPIGEVVPAGLDVAEIRQRGPFGFEAERRLMVERGIDRLVSKNSGGAETEAKIAAARALEIPVVMVRPPAKPVVAETVPTAEAALAWIAAHMGASTERGV